LYDGTTESSEWNIAVLNGHVKQADRPRVPRRSWSTVAFTFVGTRRSLA